ncbi:MAG: HAMP domain-containing protein [gamma proteobacterium symbiont of Taylorina sp.]|nr:HAMP domain-containing protein [gamma proteobacterium symbiont of Taylorina sp.]
MKITSSLTTVLIRRITFIMVISFLGILSATALITVYTTEINIKNSEEQLFQALLAKGNTLVINNSQALISMTEDNSFSSIHNLISATVKNDSDIVYGIFMDTALLPWAIVNESSLQENAADTYVLNDAVSLWSHNLKHNGYTQLNINKLPPYALTSNNNIIIYEFAAQVFSEAEIDVVYGTSSRELLGTIRYGISTVQMDVSRSAAEKFSLKIMVITLLLLFLLGCLAIFFAYIATRYTARLIINPLAELSQATIAISQGDYDTPVTIESNNELGVLSHSFNSMRIKIKETLEQLITHQKDLREKNKNLKITQDKLKDLNLHLEDKVKERTDKLNNVQQELVETARAAGMAEIAINVLHNIGNVINSVNVANQDNYALLKQSRLPALLKTNNLINSNHSTIGDYLTKDPKGKKIPELLEKLGNSLSKENHSLQENTQRMMHSIAMIGNIIATQQQYVKKNLYLDELDLQSIIEQSLDCYSTSMEKNNIIINTDFQLIPSMSGDKVKLQQVFSNLLINAVQAMQGNTTDNRQLSLRLFTEQESIIIEIRDNGSGIAENLLTDIFQHGFTTKANGNGFGLHSCANLISEMGGTIEAYSDGIGKGAAFVIKLGTGELKAL